MDDERIGTLISIMDNDDESIRQKAGRRLVRMGEAAIPLLIEALKSDNQRLRECAAIVLSLMGEKAVPAVGELMRSDDPDIKLSAMLTLAMIRTGIEEGKGRIAEPGTGAALEGRDMAGEVVQNPAFLKAPVKRQEEPTVRFRPQRRSG
jgi:hypothetical protein